MVVMPRPVWSGTISFGLVAIPVKLFHAVSRKSVSFNQLDERTMSRIRYRKVSDETGEEVPDENIIKGYEVSKGKYVVVDPDELEPFMPAATKAVELEEFVELSFQYADYSMRYGQTQSGPPSIVSTVKINQAGFTEMMDTEAMFRKWLVHARASRLLP